MVRVDVLGRPSVMHDINMEQYVILSYRGRVQKGFFLYARSWGSSGMCCSEPELWTSAAEGPEGCGDKMGAVKQPDKCCCSLCYSVPDALVRIQCRPWDPRIHV